MKFLLCVFLLLVSPATLLAQSDLEGIVKVDHTWVQGSYWSPGKYPGLGVLVDVQEDTMFGAVYGYMGNDPSFVVFVGTTISVDPLVFDGDVYFVIEPGVEEEIVGTFRWESTYSEASPAARLSITSNILNDPDLQLVRFAYLEEDKVDTITGGDWTIATRILGITFGDHYAISDERFVDEGITYARVYDLLDQEKLGLVAYFPPAEGDLYAMVMEFDEDSLAFYVFFANNGNMYGRHWLIDVDELPEGDGNFFRGVADTLQVQNYAGGGDPTASGKVEVQRHDAEASASLNHQLKQLRKSAYRSTTRSVARGFPENDRMNAYLRLRSQMGAARSPLD